jgi:hypothetical protein
MFASMREAAGWVMASSSAASAKLARFVDRPDQPQVLELQTAC